jgi:hypothetical protein
MVEIGIKKEIEELKEPASESLWFVRLRHMQKVRSRQCDIGVPFALRMPYRALPRGAWISLFIFSNMFTMLCTPFITPLFLGASARTASSPVS